MAAIDQNDFQRGDDFISFGASPPPAGGPSEAGPSRSALSSADQDSLDSRNGRSRQDAPAAQVKKKDKSKKGKGKEKASEPNGDVAGKKRQRGGDDPVGPRNLKEERRAAERHAPWTDLVDWDACQDPAEMLNAEIDAFYRHVSPTRQEYEVRLFMIEIITRAILRVWPDAEVTPFGSWQTQLYLPHGDIDLVVSTKRLNDANKARLLAELARAMRQAHITDVVAIISKARVPIIKFVTTEGKLNVDISLNQTNGISAGQIINQYLDVLPGSRQLILVVKAFLSQRSMNEVYTGGLGSYAVICLVISFLQLHPKLRRADIDPEENLGTLLVEFFELYGRNFSYDEVGISIRRGGMYFAKKSRNWYRPQQPFLLCIEDPQDRDNDISSGSFGIRQVKNTLAGAYEMLQARLFERAEQISGKQSGRYQGDWDPDEMSILTGVMGITKETQKHRRELRKLHEEGRLQRQLSIPPNASPEGYVQNYRPPTATGVKRKAGSIRLVGASRTTVTGPNGDDDQPVKKKMRNETGMGAVMLDDDVEDGELSEGSEIFEDDDDEEEEEEDEDDYLVGGGVSRAYRGAATHESDSEKEVDGALIAEDTTDASISGVVGIEGADTSTEDGEIAEVSPFAEPAPLPRRQARDESVSHDSDDYEIQPSQPRSHVDVEGGDSRYKALKKGKEKAPGRGKGKAGKAKEVEVISDSDSDGSSIIAISRPPSPPKAKPNGSSKVPKGKSAEKASLPNGPGAGGVGKKQKREFWLAKAGSKQEEGEIEDEFGGGADFVRL